jgi:hypothetical protein
MDDLELRIRDAMFSLMTTLYEQGIYEVHVGGMMRMLGIDDSIAQEHDDERMALDENFVAYMTEINTPRPANQTLH